MNKIENLCIALPEDILKAKWHGDFEYETKLIDIRLNNENTPSCMKERLELEKEIIKELPLEYPYTIQDGLELIKREIPDFTLNELLYLIDEDKADWIYVNGEKHLFHRFFSTLKKVDPSIAKRSGTTKTDEDFELLLNNIAEMKNKNTVSWHHRIKASIKINENAFIPNKKVRVHLPIPSECLNIKNIKINDYTKSPILHISNENSRTIYFEETMTKNHSFYVEYEYDCIANYHSILTNGTISKYDAYLEEKYPAIVFTPLMKQLAKEIKGTETDPLKIAKKIYDFCTKNVTYSFMRKYLTNTCIPDYVGAGLKGDCGVQAILFVTLCRICNIPAHFQSGLYVTPGEIGCHDWAMFYVEPYKWLFADPSFGGSAYRANHLEMNEFYFGNLDPFRMVANNDICNEFDPPKIFLRNDPYDNQTGEIEYEDMRLSSRDTTYTMESIACYQIK